MSEAVMPDALPPDALTGVTTAASPAPRAPSQPLVLAHANCYSNQQLIDAFFDTANVINHGDYEGLLTRAGLDVIQLAADRKGRYAGPTLAQLPNLSAEEVSLIHQSLLRQLQRRSSTGTADMGKVNAPAGLNVRTGPGRDYDLLVSLPLGSEVAILSSFTVDEAEEWLLVQAGDHTGWVFAELVDRHNTHATEPVTAIYNGPLEAGMPLEPPSNADPHTAGAAATWNQYGGLIAAECERLDLDPAVAVAILGVESSGRAFENGRLVIRFENHIFLRYWGEAHRDLFDRHFTGSSNGNEHRWRPDPNGEWRPCHTGQATEWQVLELARSFDEQAALYSISMGAAQIMGFNHASIGYATVQAMFAAFQADVRHQLLALFRFIEVNHLQDAVRGHDFATFARTYNGPGQEAIYAPRLQRYYDAFTRLSTARGDALAVGRLPQPGAPSMLASDPELMAAWSKHVAALFANNETVFRRLLDGFLRPYWTTVWMYRILFALGVLSFLLAAGQAIAGGSMMPVMTFGGLSIIALLGYFFNRPLQALEQNLQFLTWLGIIYNSYWTSLTLLNNEQTVQADIDTVTTQAIDRIQALVAEHAKRSRARVQLRLPFAARAGDAPASGTDSPGKSQGG